MLQTPEQKCPCSPWRRLRWNRCPSAASKEDHSRPDTSTHGGLHVAAGEHALREGAFCGKEPCWSGCLFFSPFNSIFTLAINENNFAHAKSISPVTVKGKWFPWLYLDPGAFPSYFVWLSCWGKGLRKKMNGGQQPAKFNHYKYLLSDCVQ